MRKRKLRRRLKELEELFDRMWKADQRAIKLWQKENPGNDNVWPDRAKLMAWLLHWKEPKMADAKRMNAMRPIIQSLIDQGKLLEAGWQSFRSLAIPLNTPTKELDSMKECFFAGASMTFQSVIFGMDADREPTEDDERRMEGISNELNGWDDLFRLKYGPSPTGSA